MSSQFGPPQNGKHFDTSVRIFHMYASYLCPLRGPRRMLRCAPEAFDGQYRDVQRGSRFELEKWHAEVAARDGVFHSAAEVQEGATALALYVEVTSADTGVQTNAPWARHRREDWDLVLIPLPSSPPVGVVRCAVVVRGLAEFHISLAGTQGWCEHMRVTRRQMDGAPCIRAARVRRKH